MQFSWEVAFFIGKFNSALLQLYYAVSSPVCSDRNKSTELIGVEALYWSHW